MIKSQSYIGNLDFLNEFSKVDEKKESLFYFFKSNFKDNTWLLEFKKGLPLLINFNVILKDNSLLTDIKNETILNTLKEWIINFLYNDKHYMNSTKTIKGDVYLILRFFDVMNYFDDGSLVTNSFKCLSKDKLHFIIDKMSFPDDIYNVKRIFTDYINNNKLNKNMFFSSRKKSSHIMKELFPNLIVLPTFRNLEFKTEFGTYISEYSSFFRNNNNLENITIPNNIKRILKHIPSKSNKKISTPFKENIDYILNYNFETTSLKRVETYPSNVVFNTFKKAVEFHFKYGDLLINNYVKIIELKNNNKDLDHIELNKILTTHIDKNLIDLGVISFRRPYQKENFDNKYYSDIRANYYFYDLIKVYYGCIQFIVGALMGRRVSELLSLTYNSCYDEKNLLLLFKRSKSEKGLFGIKDYIALPIDPLAIDMIKNLRKIITACDIKDKDNIEIFSIPSGVKINTISEKLYSNTYNNNLDFMQDYFEVDVIDSKRLYIRQHQLRRFLAMTFFWSSGFGSLDTLRWFLGHTDIQHVYKYISETESGNVLRSVKAQFIAENINEYQDTLKDFIKKKFNTENYTILKTAELIDFLEVLQEEKNINIEPEFFESDNKQQFKIILKIKGE